MYIIAANKLLFNMSNDFMILLKLAFTFYFSVTKSCPELVPKMKNFVALEIDPFLWLISSKIKKPLDDITNALKINQL